MTDATYFLDMAQPRNAAPCILFVDEDELVRAATVRALSKVGYDVRDFGSAPQALAAMRAGFTPDLLAAEVQMVAMSGIDLAHAARALFPGLPIVLVSGYPTGARGPPAMPRGSHFLAKPFTPAELLVQVGRALAQARR